MNWLKTTLDNIELTQKKKIIIAIISITLIIVLLLIFFGFKKDPVVGRYDYYRLEIDDKDISLGEDIGYIEIPDVNNKEECKIYIEMVGDFSLLTGYVFSLPDAENYDGSITYRFDIISNVGSLLENTEYIYFYYYPHRGDNGIIRISSPRADLFFSK